MDEDIIASLIGIIPAMLTCFISVWVFKMGRKLETVHTLVNSNLGVALQLNAANSKWRADMSGKPEDIQAADQALVLLKEHERNQANVDKTNIGES